MQDARSIFSQLMTSIHPHWPGRCSLHDLLVEPLVISRILNDEASLPCSCSSRHQRLVEEDVTVTKMPPKFLGPLKGTTVIREGQRAHFETRVEPQNDATMKVRPLI